MESCLVRPLHPRSSAPSSATLALDPPAPRAGPEPIRAVIFDLEGALVETGIWRFQALDRVLRLHGCVVPASDLLARLAGQPVRHKLDRLSVSRGLPRGLHPEILALEQRLALCIVERNCHPDIERMGVLRTLAQRGLKLGAVAHTGRQLAETLVRRSGLAPFLDALVCDDDLADTSAHATLPRLLLRQLGVAPDQTLAVAATACVVRDARQGGAHVLAIDGPLDLATIDASLAALRTTQA